MTKLKSKVRFTATKSKISSSVPFLAVNLTSLK